MRGSSSARERATNVFRPFVVCLALFFWLIGSGCNNACVSITSNPPTGVIRIKVTDGAPTCTLSTATGNVRLQLNASAAAETTSAPAGVQHIFMSLKGVEVHPSSVADPDSPDGQELAPQLAQRPVQVDLMAPPSETCAASAFGEIAVAAGAYRQIRLRLLSNQPPASEPVPAPNACGSAGFHCVVTADGRVRPLALVGGAPEFLIASEKIEGGLIFILPDTSTDLAIEFDPRLSLALPAGNAVRLFPAFRAARRPPCQSRRAGSEQ